MPLFDRHINTHLVVFFTSLIGAILLYYLGGYVSETSGLDKATGAKWQATGTLAGFMILYSVSLFGISRLVKSTGRNVRLTINAKGKPKKFEPADKSYKCTCFLFDAITGNKRTHEVAIGWQAGFMVIYIFDVGENDLISVRVTNSKNEVWECDSFASHSRNADLVYREGTSQPSTEAANES